MVVQTARNAVKQCPDSCVVVATDSEQIRQTCYHYGIYSVLTSPECRTGTDRVAEAAKIVSSSKQIDYNVIVNMQGDEPLMPAGSIKAVVNGVWNTGSVCCGMAPIKSKEDQESPHVGKVVCDQQFRALYISRAKIPAGFQGKVAARYTQVCAYAFWPADLRKFAEYSQTELELAEGIELLRWIENGRTLQMIPVKGERMAVDVPEDLERVNEEYHRRQVAEA